MESIKNPSTKEEWRALLRKALLISDDSKAVASKRVTENIWSLLLGARGPIAGFMPLATEPDLTPLYQGIVADWVFPRVDGDQLKFYRADTSEFTRSSFGVLEPKPEPSRLVPLSEISWMLVPGLGFDRRGVRLGRGKGYYDKALANYNGLSIGVCFNQSVTNTHLPKEPHDCVLNWIVTDSFVLKTSVNSERN